MSLKGIKTGAFGYSEGHLQINGGRGVWEETVGVTLPKMEYF